MSDACELQMVRYRYRGIWRLAGAEEENSEQVSVKASARKGTSMRMFLKSAALMCGTLISGASIAAPFGAASTITGAPFHSSGQVTIVHYWATWCAPCRAEMPILDGFYRKHHRQGLEMLAISIDQGVSTARLKEVTGRFAFPVARVDDVMMPRRDIPTALPVTRVYDGSGKLVFATKGDGRTIIDAATLDRVISPLLAGH